MSAAPSIKPNPNGTPFLWSVMIPCYNPRPDYLAATLRSVLQQDPGPAEMEIVVIDDASPKGSPEKLVREIAGDRVTFQRLEKNLGLAGVWNHCLDRARGRWLHVLHQDDVIKPGFYQKLRHGIEASQSPGLVFCRHEFMDGQGQITRISQLEAESPGCLRDALPRLARAQAIQTPCVVVRRSVFEAVGGFRSDLCFTLDWEMWCRIARRFPVWYEPEPLAVYRVHAGAETSRQVLTGEDIADVRRCIRIISGYIEDAPLRAEVRRHAAQRSALFALKHAGDLARAGRRDAAWRQMSGALKCDCSPKVLKQALKLLPALLAGGSASKNHSANA